MADKTFKEHLSQLPESLKEFASQIDGPSFAAGGAVGVVVGAVVTLVVENLDSKGAFDPVADFFDHMKAYGDGVEVVAADVIEVPLDDSASTIEVEAEAIDDEEAEA